jgi:hypothetical protein
MLNQLFLNCTSVTEIDIRKADFSNVTNYNLMFSEIPKTTKIYGNYYCNKLINERKMNYGS